MSDAPAEPDMQAPGGPERLKSNRIWIDASVYRAQRFDWKCSAFKELAHLSELGLIRVVMTPITYSEVIGLMREAWAEANKGVQAAAVVLDQLDLPDVAATVADEALVLIEMQMAFDAWLITCRAVHVKAEPDLPAAMADYFAGRPPFGPGKKKSEFPDALVVSSLRRMCTDFGQKVYVVSNDGDLRGCCTPDSPFIATKSLKEVLSHGRGSAVLHDIVSVAISESDDFREAIWDQVPELEAKVEKGYRHGARVDVEAGRISLYDLDVTEVVIDDVEDQEVTCTAYLYTTLEVHVRFEQEVVQMSEDEWDPGFHHSQGVHVTAPMTASVKVTMLPGDVVRLDDVHLDDSKIYFGFDEVARALD